jgi:hypothetical protein
MGKRNSNRSAAKQQMLFNIENESFNPQNVDPRNAKEVQMFIDHMQAKLDNDILLLEAERANTLNKLANEFSSGIFKMTKAMRQMTIAEFNAANDCDIVDILRSTKQSFREPAAAPSAAAPSAGFETPAIDRRHRLQPPPSRTVRRNEKVHLLSDNGSPVEFDKGAILSTFKKEREPSMEIHMGRGRFVNIDDAERMSQATSGEKKVVKSQLQQLKSKIDMLMSSMDG